MQWGTQNLRIIGLNLGTHRGATLRQRGNRAFGIIKKFNRVKCLKLFINSKNHSKSRFYRPYSTDWKGSRKGSQIWLRFFDSGAFGNDSGEHFLATLIKFFTITENYA